ncbi:hypothetical protein C8Q76DRAFT_692518 [Earliella scabrosa]|nr:hypothetical protein C8Q76DRAFT_692518 [Earliella scabrosa]
MALVPANAAPIRHHPDHYPVDGSLVVHNLDNDLYYNLYASQFARHSDPWATMLTLDPGQGQVREGSSDLNPVTISVDGAEWDHLLDFFAGLRVETEEALRGIINQAMRWEMDEVAEYAFNRLAANPNLSPVLQLEIGVQHDIYHWVEIGFRRLAIETPLSALTRRDVQRLGSYGYYLITQARFDIEEQRRLLCYWVPSIVNDSSCPFKTGCRISWKTEWWSGIAKHLLNPDIAQRRTPREILEELYAMDVTFMCQACKDLTVAAVLEEPALNYERDTLREVARFQRLLTSSGVVVALLVVALLVILIIWHQPSSGNYDSVHGHIPFSRTSSRTTIFDIPVSPLVSTFLTALYLPHRHPPYFIDINLPHRHPPYFIDINLPHRHPPYFIDINLPHRHPPYFIGINLPHRPPSSTCSADGLPQPIRLIPSSTCDTTTVPEVSYYLMV